MLRQELENKATEAVTMVYGDIIGAQKERLQNMYLLGVMEGVDKVVNQMMTIEDPEVGLNYLEELTSTLNEIRLDMMQKEALLRSGIAANIIRGTNGGL